MSQQSQQKPLKGILHFHAETGTEGGLWAFMDNEKIGYAGLHILKDRDVLTIYSKKGADTRVWSGTIELLEYPVFTEHAFGFWIHSDQKNVERKTWAAWFFNHYPAELILAL
ncbi:hypothetical protein A2673_01240 [Candidatus Kaiserbacteria bacterium RIFCSPHIGHO2_01_FULL_50_13]|uniref:Uncharacterized protein n=1 Tax=Candidatus Kaiserbacteria bacterium RIFCSPLOWO2_01_FULL_50_24 TaxID=1798507 RepID=A0A1F6ENB7_9BACT|nr:MAG: hypothetical protein A2673_01240 [Candidatus Kaiserbacteria bacterium RIFCSPHIGHO2_01_FULL_50_13]OGG75124.1 MAG: hypothetical protein A3A34_02090 [Candidatus Kaiserbacteria bacterium RIFCSPLOWO2_01_FULL_50_24]OGG82224.1 MAG: hypothetical protein A3H74_02570 [Candidatus Kaiserbacteria bacterium RIFCSPLOWO2_02_FULL_51_13]